jgi:hypothetical protein
MYDFNNTLKTVSQNFNATCESLLHMENVYKNKLHINLWKSKIISKQFYNTFIKSQYKIIFIDINYTLLNWDIYFFSLIHRNPKTDIKLKHI